MATIAATLTKASSAEELWTETIVANARFGSNFPSRGTCFDRCGMRSYKADQRIIDGYDRLLCYLTLAGATKIPGRNKNEACEE
jgi:hypothetical protein